ncbi:MAG TPA: hypothetical protein VKB46_04945 [Pyrinomonadaceae bacterium]|nr:hypothetical protein [Pyrinomonadaceae bacterium]
MTSPVIITSPQLQVRTFLLPKRAHTAVECEDAIGINELHHRFALADGATEAFDARNWAQRLALNWVQTRTTLSLPGFSEWLAAEGRSLHDSWNELKLPWYSEEKARGGSFAAFVGVELEPAFDGWQWRAIILGDSCLFHCRQHTLLKKLPLTKSADFGSNPVLAASHPSVQATTFEHVVVDGGVMKPGDQLLLLTDGVAAWYLLLDETGDFETRSVFARVLRDEDNAALTQLFESERSTGRLKNDDIAIISLEV